MSLLPWLLLLHVLGAIIAFGPGFTFALIGSMGGKEPMHANFATRVSNKIGTSLVYPLAVVQGITGVALIIILGADLTSPAYRWLVGGIILYLIAIGFAILVQAKNAERMVHLMNSMPPGPPPAGAPAGPPPEIAELGKKLQQGGMLLSVLVVLIVILMVTKPTF